MLTAAVSRESVHRVAALVRVAAGRWSDDSVATGWLVNRARSWYGIAISTRTAFRLIRTARGTQS